MGQKSRRFRTLGSGLSRLLLSLQGRLAEAIEVDPTSSRVPDYNQPSPPAPPSAANTPLSRPLLLLLQQDGGGEETLPLRLLVLVAAGARYYGLGLALRARRQGAAGTCPPLCSGRIGGGEARHRRIVYVFFLLLSFSLGRNARMYLIRVCRFRVVRVAV
jgi:hypothetical protein